jgi:hypothetical protein
VTPPSTEVLHAEILKLIAQISVKVEESLQLARQTGEALARLRIELGMEGSYGRLPAFEQSLARIEVKQEQMAKAIEAIKQGESEARGRKQFVRVAWSLLRGGAGAALVGLLAKRLGLIH